jgi:hypothetical protein
VSPTPRPLFLFSLPRSGSTLLQRLLAGHPDIATTAEPWILLPLLYTMRRPGVYGEYGHRSMVRAVEDFYEQLDGGRERYLQELRALVLQLYAGSSNGERYFLDKTPRYHLVVDQIMELFPDGRFIFLWRQPLAVAASIVESFGRGHWNLEKHSIDIVGGLSRLVAAAGRDDQRSISVRYEDLVEDPERELATLYAHLGLEHVEQAVSTRPTERPSGRMGDRTGAVEYSTITADPLDKWRITLGTAYRKRWIRRYLETIGPSRLQIMGYDYEQLSREVDALDAGPRSLGSDLARSVHDRINRRVAGRLIYPSAAELRAVAERGFRQ